LKYDLSNCSIKVSLLLLVLLAFFTFSCIVFLKSHEKEAQDVLQLWMMSNFILTGSMWVVLKVFNTRHKIYF